MQNHLQNHPKGQNCPVLTVGWPMLSDFIVENWKSDFCDSCSTVKIGLFPIKSSSVSLDHNLHDQDDLTTSEATLVMKTGMIYYTIPGESKQQLQVQGRAGQI